MDIKCRKCRVLLPFDEKLCLQQNKEENSCCSSFEQILPIADAETKFPDWLETCLNEGDWCKGKIFCPKCQAKLGGFDFVNGMKCHCQQHRLLPEIHLNKCKIDIFDPTKSATSSTVNDHALISSQLMEKIKLENWPVLSVASDSVTPLPVTRNFSPNKTKTHRKTRSWHATTSNLIGGALLNTFLGNFLVKRTESSPKIDTVIDSTGNSTVVNANTTDLNDCRIKVSKKQAMPIDDKNHAQKHCSFTVPDYLLCCICLEIFCLPRSCMPCCHTFCEPCLRSLANVQRRLSPGFSHFKVHCPLCRQLIHFTLPNQELLEVIKVAFFDEYRERLNWYKTQNSLKRVPLPGVESWAHVHRLLGNLPSAWSRRLTSRFSPLWTLYSFCLTFLCFVFFFICFIPAVYVSTYLYNYVGKFEIDFGAYVNIFFSEVSAFFAYVINGGHFLPTFTFVALISSVILYLVFLW